MGAPRSLGRARADRSAPTEHIGDTISRAAFESGIPDCRDSRTVTVHLGGFSKSPGSPLLGTGLLLLASGAAVAVPPLGNVGEAVSRCSARFAVAAVIVWFQHYLTRILALFYVEC
ncbi:hypothetical protein [Nocardia abscessus]|uniref:hypothetical protein n=1 Tax=Nocardia abscessus TaxID=120957 RepID=UPI002456E204|nr:hypothetical protein [Nocardia abscessus]